MKTNKEKAPKWLIEGAMGVYSAKHDIFLSSLFALFSFVPIVIFLFPTAPDSPGKINPWLYIAFVITVATIHASVIYFLMSLIIKKVIGQNKKWQNKYLQSKIDEYESYRLEVPGFIAKVNEEAAEKIKEYSDNLDAMFKKRNEALDMMQQLNLV